MKIPREVDQEHESGIDPSRHDEGSKRPPRLQIWHGIFCAMMVCVSTVGMLRLETKWDKDATRGRLIWNATIVHTGPFAGIYQWDQGDAQPDLIRQTMNLLTGQANSYHGSIIAVMFPICLILILPSVGLVTRPVSKQGRLVIGAFFVLGTMVWYFAALLSI